MSEKTGVPTLGFIIPWMGGMVASNFSVTPLGILAVFIIAFVSVIFQERACK